MRKYILGFLVVVLANVAMGQQFPIPLGGEPLNVKYFTANIDTLGVADITIPIFTAPCNGYIPTYPMISSTSGSAAADTTIAQSIRLYIIAHDSIGTAVTDTIARYVTRDSSSLHGYLSAAGQAAMTALYRYRMTWVSASTARTIKEGDVICLRADFQGTTTQMRHLAVQVAFVPYYVSQFLPDPK